MFNDNNNEIESKQNDTNKKDDSSNDSDSNIESIHSIAWWKFKILIYEL